MDRTRQKCETSAFYVPSGNFKGDRVLFSPEEEHHLVKVLRKGKGTVVQVLDGEGGVFEVELICISKGRLEGRILGSEKCRPVIPRISVALGMGRPERMRYAVEKLAELGCCRIIPLVSGHVSFPGSARGQLEKLRRVSLSAMKQSRSPFLTGIGEPVSFDEFLELVENESLQPVFCKKAVNSRPAKNERLLVGKDSKKSGRLEYTVAVGPEGGFSQEEQEKIAASGYPCLHLGEADLRFETAAVAGFILIRQILSGEYFLY